ncbi:LOW QUALITY PROTEIN: hypothetical protein Cgig2_018119 [Carnegiea gigantea]|uniref:DUF8040 domain-containing protein n=1 Tax=Carnegiea gigantea TaxID=171969 RepID=A0A9Q1GFZ6_9CARY|nr:LOW QUALITY PROTEIN: hypothetical protein Cgig2_018119 [Carnegiea gigantea]
MFVNVGVVGGKIWGFRAIIGFSFCLVGFSIPICLDLWWVHGSDMSGCQMRLTNDTHNNACRMRFEGAQIKNCYNDLGKKLIAWEFLISKIGVGVDYKIGAVIVTDSTWQEFLQNIMNDMVVGNCNVIHKFGGKYKSFRKKVPTNLEKMKLAFHGSDSDEANKDGSDVDIKCLGAEESRSPLKSVHSSHNESGASSNGKRQELLDWSSRNEKVHQSLAILHMREESRQQPSLIKQVQARLKEHPKISAMGLDFMCSVMDYIKEKREEKFFLDLDDEFVVGYVTSKGMDEQDCTMDEEEGHAIDTIVIYILERFHMERPCSTLKERLLRTICRESRANYIHKLLYGNHLYLCCKVFHLDKDVFTHLVSIFMEKGLLKKGRFVKAAEIVAITFFILARAIGKYHKQVLDGLGRLFANIVRPCQSQDELPIEIVEKKGFYWPFFKVWFLPPHTL